MRLELLPIISGVLVGLLGIGLVADGWLPDSHAGAGVERRRRPRADRHRGGEVLIGFGLAALGAALIGGDAWRWSTIAVLAGIVLLILGAALNARFLREALTHRGALRRGRAADRPVE